MLLPTQDKELKTRLIQMINNAANYLLPTTSEHVVVKQRELVIDELLKEIEQRGYHKGLPSGIEEALNSGDGTYRP
jgi:hypothetical protein